MGLELNIRQDNYQYDNLSKQGSNQCNNGWQAVEATALAAVTAGVSNKTRQNIMWSLAVAVSAQGVESWSSGECCCPHMERVDTLEALCGISSSIKCDGK